MIDIENIIYIYIYIRMSTVTICTPPVIAYIVISAIMFILMFIMSIRTNGFSFGSSMSNILSNICSSLCCILILVGLCSITESPATSWIIVGIMGIYMLSSVSAISASYLMPKKTV